MFPDTEMSAALFAVSQNSSACLSDVSRWWNIVGWRIERKTKVLFHCLFAHHKSHVQWTGIKTGPPRLKSGNLQPGPWHGETQRLKERDIRYRGVVRDITIMIMIIIIIINFFVSHYTPPWPYWIWTFRLNLAKPCDQPSSHYTPSPSRAVNTLRLCYRSQWVNAV
jgi:hypothetical protein